MDTTGIKETYRGRPGCGCGCRGTYLATPRAIKGRAAEVAEAIGQDPKDIRVQDDCVALETDERYVWLYFTDEAAAQRFYLQTRGVV